MKSYEWWIGRKARVRKKYVSLFGMYYSPKDVRELFKEYEWFKAKKKQYSYGNSRRMRRKK